jgi:hypothetical protein
MLLLRPLYESWLLRSTRAHLAPWQRSLLLGALRRDEALRCLAAELAEFSHEDDAPAADNAPDLRLRLKVLLAEDARPAQAPRWGWALAGAMALTLGLVALWEIQPLRDNVEVASVRQPQEALALSLPTSTPSPTAAPTAEALAVSSAAATAITATAAPLSGTAKPQTVTALPRP